MRKSFIIALLAIFLIPILLYGVWLQFPTARNPELVSEAYAVTNERIADLNMQAEDPEKNGFLNPTFVPYWGRKDQEYQESSPTEKAVKAWNDHYSTPGKGEKIDHRSLQDAKDKDYLEALSGMEALAPELRTAINKPVFFPPKFELTADAMIPNLIAARACAQAMVGLAEAQVAQGKNEQAARDLVSVIHYGGLFNAQGTLIGDMIGVAIQAIGADGFFGLIDINFDFPANTWKSMTQTILKSTPPKDTVLRAMQGEMLFCHNTIEQISENPGAVGELGGLPGLATLPGFLEREERIYNNTMTDLILAVKADRRVSFGSDLTEPTTTDYITGRTGLIAQILIANYERADKQCRINRNRLTALATATGIAAYRAQEGRLPESLAQLSESGIPVVDEGEVLGAMEYKVTGEDATLKVRVQEAGSDIPLSYANDWEHPWMTGDNEFIVFNFGPMVRK